MRAEHLVSLTVDGNPGAFLQDYFGKIPFHTTAPKFKRILNGYLNNPRALKGTLSPATLTSAVLGSVAFLIILLHDMLQPHSYLVDLTFLQLY